MSTMSNQKPSKINQLVKIWPRGTVGVQSWLDELGINRFLAERYCHSGWLQRLGSGAYQLAGDKVEWSGAVYSLQNYLKFKIHVGAHSALELHGHRQFLGMQYDSISSLWLFKAFSEKRVLPKWFRGELLFRESAAAIPSIYYKAINLFEDEKLGLTDFIINNYNINISTTERAILEFFALTPTYYSLEQGKFVMESMATLRPKLLQQLLESCASYKVKRLFILFAENEHHPWYDSLDLSKIHFGKNKMMIGEGGFYYKKYKISLPLNIKLHEEYSDNDEPI